MSRRSNPKKRVLSFRVEEKDWLKLQSAVKKSGQDVSSLLRQSLNAIVQQAEADRSC